MIPRLLEELVLKSFSLQKIILILGARQVGKTTLIKHIQAELEKEEKKVLYLNCDIEEEMAAINTTSKIVLAQLLNKTNVLIIDEAQRLDNPGLTLKIIHDNFPRVRILATGSASFELKNTMSDPLTGRFVDFTLYPLSLAEVLASHNSSHTSLKTLQKNQADALLPQALLYGLYPEIVCEHDPQTKLLFLNKIIESYLFKDILSFQRVRNPQTVKNLTRALAYQIGSEINENELANRLKIDRKTVINYLDILEKAYVIKRLYPFSRNPRREIGKNYKVYFIDLGIRNALVGDVNPIELRFDSGSIWENFLFLERMKALANANKTVSCYFWRSYSGAEVDYIEQSNDGLQAYELKLRTNRLSKGSHAFSQKYAIPVKLIDKENYTEFIL